MAGAFRGRVRRTARTAAEHLGIYEAARARYQRIFDPSAVEARRRTRQFLSQFISTDDLVFDVGANVGTMTGLYLELGARVVAVEPLPRAAAVLERRFRGPRVCVERAALGPAEGNAGLHVARYGILSTIAPDHIAAHAKSWVDVVPVEVTTLDALMSRHGTPRFVKLDVEGYELGVLQGLSRPVEALSFEVGHATPEQTAECFDALERLGDYEFNFCRWGVDEFVFPDWVDHESVIELVATFPAGDANDVYARLR